MAEFLTMDEAKSKFGSKSRTNAGLTLGIIGTALAAFAGNNGGCGNGGGILGNLFGGNNNCCSMQAAEKAIMAVDAGLQRQLDHKIDGQLKYAYSDLCAPVPSIAPLYCSPFTSYGTGMYAGTAASNFNAVNTAINTVTGGCPSCTAQ